MLRGKFEKLKEEVNFDLGIFAGDLLGMFEATTESHPEWKEVLEDLLIMASKCAKMTPSEFWSKCESIVQTLDDHRQDLPMGIPKQVHTRLLFILTRCTRLVQFHNECGHEDSHHILGLHQLSDLGTYTEHVANITHKTSLEKTEVIEAKATKEHEVDQEAEKSVASTSSTVKIISSWKKLPSPSERSLKEHYALEVNVPSKDSSDNLKLKTEHYHAAYESSLICRICEVEIPTVHMEQHSRICTIADRCDLKGLSVNERLERVAKTLESIIDSWTPKAADMAVGSQESGRISPSRISEDSYPLSPKNHNISSHCSGDLLEDFHDAEDFHGLPNMSCNTRGSLIPFAGKALSTGCLTPRTPRANQIELFISGRKMVSEHEDYQQVS